jgi:hypothetical protein
MRNSEFSGTIPSQIGRLTQLSRLYLQTNILEGSIPMTLRPLTRLQFFQVFNNLMSGGIPALPNSLNTRDCILQQASDTNCIDCASSSAAVCTCNFRTCTPRPAAPTTPRPTTTTSTTTTPSITSSTSSTSTRSGDISTSRGTAPETSPSPQPPLESPISTETESDTSSDSDSSASFFPGSSAKKDEVPVALIAGIAGGILGLALILAVVGFIVFRMRKKSGSARSSSGGSIAMEPTRESSYSEPSDVRRPKTTLDSLDGRYADFSSSGGATQARY